MGAAQGLGEVCWSGAVAEVVALVTVTCEGCLVPYIEPSL